MNLNYVGVDNILGRAETDFKTTKKTGTQSEMGRDAFLQLLVTQLKLQDPSNPLDDKQLTAQLAQFSSLESLKNIEEGVKDLSSKLDNNTILSGIKFLGTRVKAPGKDVVKNGDSISQVSYRLNGDATRVYVNIFDANGNIVNTVELGAKMEGEYNFTWDGKDFDGNELPDGTYKVSFGAEGQNGESVLVDCEVAGKVIGVTKQDNTLILQLEDGREVPMDQVEDVTMDGSSQVNTQTSDENTENSDSTEESDELE